MKKFVFFLKKRVYFLIISSILLIIVLLGSVIVQLVGIPKFLRISPQQSVRLLVYYPLSFHPLTKKMLKNETGGKVTNKLELKSGQKNSFDVELRLLGAIPVKRLRIEVAKAPQVIPSGQAVGILLSSKGLVVVGHLPVKGIDGKLYYPAKDAGLQLGDLLLAINKEPMNRISEVESFLKNTKHNFHKLELTIKRQQQIKKLYIRPVLTFRDFRTKEKRYRLGLYLEDPAAGVGTMTFYTPDYQGFAGLGHRIGNFAGRRDIPFARGEIVLADICGTKKGCPGQPGEKIGIFSNNALPIGIIEKNCRFGIYGKLLNNKVPRNNLPIDAAYNSEIKTGSAKIYTVINGTKIEEFQVKIIKVFKQRRPGGKGLILKVTDPALLKKTGGIIQGMSGSPIIQNGKFIGAVTHVFVNDPTKGYGVLAEWMLKELKEIVNQSSKAS